jgi:cyanophycinase
VFPTASAEPEGSMGSAIRAFDAVGGAGTAVGIFLTVDNPEDAQLPETVSQIEGCSGFYFVGGSQFRIVQVFRPESGESPAFQALLSRHGEGAVVSGSSAGAAIMTDPMIGGGNSLGALSAGVRAEGGDEGVILRKGLGLWDGAFVDQHFLARGRWARLLVAVLATEGFDFGLGIDENTALVVDGNSARVAGASGVVFFDTRGVVREEGGSGWSGIHLRLLGSGDRVLLPEGTVQVAADKMAVLADSEVREELNGDLFDRWALLGFLSMAAKSPQDTYTFQQDGYTFEFEKAPGFQGLSWDGEGVEGAPSGFSVGPFQLRISTEPSGEA